MSSDDISRARVRRLAGGRPVHFWNVRNPRPVLECGLEIEQNASADAGTERWRGPIYALHVERVTCAECLRVSEGR